MKKNGVYQGIKNSMVNMAGNMLKKMSLAAGTVLATVAAAGLAVALSGTDVVYAEDYVDGGIKWTISGDTLTIEPAGEGNTTDEIANGVMKDYSDLTSIPWRRSDEYGNVKKIVVENGVTHVGEKALGNPSGEPKELESVVIKSDVASIGKLAFCNTTINIIDFYGIGLLSDNIDHTAFVSSGDGNDWYININNISCYKKTDGVHVYFSTFNAGDINYGNNKIIRQSHINISYYNVVVSSTNLLGDDDKVYAQFTGADEIEADTSGSNVPSDAVLIDFIVNHNYDVTKLKLFNIVMSDSNGSISEAKIKVPIPDSWRETGNVKLLAYYADEKSISVVDSANTDIVTVDDKNYFSFTTNDYRTYALYYDYNENPQTEISITTDFFQGVYQWNINNGSATLATPTSAAATDAFNAFKNTYDSNYKLDAVHLRAFDISATVDGNSVSDAIANLKVRIPVPTEWESYASSVKVLTITNSAIAEVQGVDVKTVDGKKYLEFTPPHFSPYALYYANAGETPTTQPTTSAQQPTTSNGNGNNNNSTTSYTQATTKAPGGSLDNTPNTGVKDVMWILIPAATLLLGVGIVVLARRKKNINDNY